LPETWVWIGKLPFGQRKRTWRKWLRSNACENVRIIRSTPVVTGCDVIDHKNHLIKKKRGKKGTGHGLLSVIIGKTLSANEKGQEPDMIFCGMSVTFFGICLGVF
jgi:hypothetical protein